MSADFSSVHRQLHRFAAANKAGDIEASAEASALLISLADECKAEGTEGAEQFLRFLLEATLLNGPDSEPLRALLGGCVLDWLPQLMQLATASQRAADTAATLVELLAGRAPPGLATNGAECQMVCSPRELLTALLEVYDIHKDSTAFDTPIRLLLLRLLGLIPHLVAAVQRRRLAVALSCLPLVADLAVTAGMSLIAVRGLAAAAVAGGGSGGGDSASDASGAAKVDATATALELWSEAEQLLVAPFVVFTQQLQERVLVATELSERVAPPRYNSTDAATGNSVTPPPQPPTRSESLTVALWLLALFGALWPAWGAMMSASGGGGSTTSWCGTPAAATLLNILFRTYLEPKSQTRQLHRLGLGEGEEGAEGRAGRRRVRLVDGGGDGDGDGDESGGRGGGGAPGCLDWLELWFTAGAAEDPETEVASDRELPLLGAATIIWMAATATTAGVATHMSDVAAPKPPSGDRIGALKVLLEACQVLLRYDEGGLNAVRALQLLAAGSVQVSRIATAFQQQTASLNATAGPPPTHINTDSGPAANNICTADAAGVESTAVAVVVQADDDPWVVIANRIGARSDDGTTIADLCKILEECCRLDSLLHEREAALKPLVVSLASTAGITMTHHGPDRPAAEANRTLAHTALQAMLGALTPSLRALCIEYLVAGPSPVVSALALQRLQREIATATAATDNGAASLVGRTAVFNGPWVLRVVLQQLQQLQQLLFKAEAKADRASEALAVAALQHRADATTAAVSVLRFLALRQRSAVAEAATAALGSAQIGPKDRSIVGAAVAAGREPSSQEAVMGEDNATSSRAAATTNAVGDVKTTSTTSHFSCTSSAAAAARGAVLTAVYEAAVRPLYSIIPGALAVLQRQVELEDGAIESVTPLPRTTTAMPLPSPWPPPEQQQQPLLQHEQCGKAVGCTADRFAGNVAVVSDAVAGLTAISRLHEVLDCVRELLCSSQGPDRVAT